MSNILFELGCEELPPQNLKKLRDALHINVMNALKNANIAVGKVTAFATPRRLALIMADIADNQPDSVEEKRGPAVQAAFDADGNPTKAAQGFARGAGVTVDKLARLKTDKGEWLLYQKAIKGKATTELLPAIIQKALDDLPIAKRMRSGAQRNEFVRPVKWVVLIKDVATGAEVIPAQIQSHQTSNITYGHRFHAPQSIELTHVDDYEQVLENAKVVACFDKRQAQIKQQVSTLATEVDAKAIMPADLLDEVTALVELPVALRATFEARFLSVPQEALIYTMQKDQKYFCLTDDANKLKPFFITIANIESKDPQQIIAGNEKVVRPRLSDAEFFFQQDQKQPLFALTENLKNVVFQEKLGTVWDKSERVAKLAAFIAKLLIDSTAKLDNVSVEHATRAALLAKCDLVSQLVYEFPDMQGIAGKYYATLNNEPEDVASSLLEQYLPKGAGDTLPHTATGICLALADRMDTLVGIFGIGELPTGSKDPFSLRRAAIGVLRILIEKQLEISLPQLLQVAIQGFGQTDVSPIKQPDVTFIQVMEFMQSRYRAMYEDQGIAVDVIQSVLAINPHMPLDFDQRIRAVQVFKQLPEASLLAEANKRVANILAKSEADIANVVNSTLLVEAPEMALFDSIQEINRINQTLIANQEYAQVLTNLAKLQAPLTQFFDDVMVNVDDAKVKANRLALLAHIRDAFLTIADVSLLA